MAFDHYILGWSFELNGFVPEALNISTLPSLPEHASIFKEKPKSLMTIWLPVGSVVLLTSMAHLRQCSMDYYVPKYLI